MPLTPEEQLTTASLAYVSKENTLIESVARLGTGTISALAMDAKAIAAAMAAVSKRILAESCLLSEDHRGSLLLRYDRMMEELDERLKQDRPGEARMRRVEKRRGTPLPCPFDSRLYMPVHLGLLVSPETAQLAGVLYAEISPSLPVPASFAKWCGTRGWSMRFQRDFRGCSTGCRTDNLDADDFGQIPLF